MTSQAGRRWWQQSQRRRVLGSAALGLVMGLVVGRVAPWQLALMVGWDTAAVAVLLRVWLRVGRFTAAQTREFATREDDSRASAELLLVMASVGSLVGAGLGLLEANQSEPGLQAWLTSAAILTVALSWGVVHTVFTLRYAHQYCTAATPHPIDFNVDDFEPDYADFAYLAFTVGMTFQVSDTDIRDALIRRTILRHALISYLFGAVIVAFMVNAIASVLNR